jgi:hypothetical protein
LVRHVAASVVAGVLVAVDPILVHQSTLVMTETLAVAIVAAVACVWLTAVKSGFTAGRCLMLGGLLAAAYLCRPTFLVWAGLLVAALAWKGLLQWRVEPLRWRPPVIVGGIVALAVGGWMARNGAAVGHPVWATTHGGYTLLLANNPDVYEHLRRGEPIEDWNPNAFFAAFEHRYAGDPRAESFWQTDWSAAGPPMYPDDAGEVNDDRYVGAAAKATIARDPGMFAWACGCRVRDLWTPFPAVSATGSQTVSAVIGCYYLLLSAFVVAGTYRFSTIARLRSWLAWFPIAAMVVTLSAVHAVYWSNMRMRAPAMPLIAIVAAGGFLWTSTRRDGDVANG